MAIVVDQYPASVIGQTVWWLSRFRDEFLGDIPNKIHAGHDDLSEDGTPEWHVTFARWMSARVVIDQPRPEVRTETNRLRTTKALRKLRQVAVREYEVVYRIMVLKDSIENTTIWLNDRAERNNIPLPEGRSVHYSNKDTSCILFSGIDKMRDWWQQS